MDAGQSGTPNLRALVYMDEVFGYVPPSAALPAKKPILTILKQARAFGLGMVLSTQNPVDLDYKAISNAGTWMIDRLQTERDVGRLSDGLKSSSGEVDIAEIECVVVGMGETFDADEIITVDYDDRDLRESAPDRAAEELEVDLEKTDISVTQLALIWVPV